MASDTEVSLDISSHLGIFHGGFWLFIAAPVSQFAVFTSRTPNTCTAVGWKGFLLGFIEILAENLNAHSEHGLHIFKMSTVGIYTSRLLAMIL